MDRRYSSLSQVDYSIYDEITSEIRRLLTEGHEVVINSVVDKRKYKDYLDFRRRLVSGYLIGRPVSNLQTALVADELNELNLDTNFNSKHEAMEIIDYFIENGDTLGVDLVFPGLGMRILTASDRWFL